MLRQVGRLTYNKKAFSSRDGGTGRRSGLKIRRPSGLGGSTPPPGTTVQPIHTWLVNRRTGPQGRGVQISVFEGDSAQTLTKLIFGCFLLSGGFGVVALLPCF